MSYLLHQAPAVGRRLLYRLIVCGDDAARMIGAWHVFRLSFQNAEYAPLADKIASNGVTYRRLLANVASEAITIDEFRLRAERTLRSCFNDDDKDVRRQAGDVFRNLKPFEFERFKPLAEAYVKSKAFETDSWAFFHAASEAECEIDDVIILATERIIEDIKEFGNAGGRRSLDLHQLQEILRDEYAASEFNPELRRRLLDLIDAMLKLELYGVDTIIAAHER